MAPASTVDARVVQAGPIRPSRWELVEPPDESGPGLTKESHRKTGGESDA